MFKGSRCKDVTCVGVPYNQIDETHSPNSLSYLSDRVATRKAHDRCSAS